MEEPVTEHEAKVLVAIARHMNPERTARYTALLAKAEPEPRDVDELNGIIWVKIQLLMQLGAHSPDKAFTPEGEDFQNTCNLQHQYIEKAARISDSFNAKRMILAPDGKPAN